MMIKSTLPFCHHLIIHCLLLLLFILLPSHQVPNSDGWNDFYLRRLGDLPPETIASIETPFEQLTRAMTERQVAYGQDILFRIFWQQLLDCTRFQPPPPHLNLVTASCSSLFLFLQDLGLLPHRYRAKRSQTARPELEQDWLAFYAAHQAHPEAVMVADHLIAVPPSWTPLLPTSTADQQPPQSLGNGRDPVYVTWAGLLQEFLRNSVEYGSKPPSSTRRLHVLQSTNRFLKLKVIYLLLCYPISGNFLGEKLLFPFLQAGGSEAVVPYEPPPPQPMQHAYHYDPNLVMMAPPVAGPSCGGGGGGSGSTHQNQRQRPWRDDYLAKVSASAQAALAAAVNPLFHQLTEAMELRAEEYGRVVLFRHFYRQFKNCSPSDEEGIEDTDDPHLSPACNELLQFLEDLGLLPERYRKGRKQATTRPLLDADWFAFYRANRFKPETEVMPPAEQQVAVPEELQPLLDDQPYQVAVYQQTGMITTALSYRHLMAEFLRNQNVYSTKVSRTRKWCSFESGDPVPFLRLLKLRSLYLMMVGGDFRFWEGGGGGGGVRQVNLRPPPPPPPAVDIYHGDPMMAPAGPSCGGGGGSRFSTQQQQKQSTTTTQKKRPPPWKDEYLAKVPASAVETLVDAVNPPFHQLTEAMELRAEEYGRVVLFRHFYRQFKNCSPSDEEGIEDTDDPHLSPVCAELLQFLEDLGLLPGRYYRKGYRTTTRPLLDADWFAFYRANRARAEAEVVPNATQQMAVSEELLPLLDDPARLVVVHQPTGITTISYRHLMAEFLRYQDVYSTKVVRKSRKGCAFNTGAPVPFLRLLKLRTLYLMILGRWGGGGEGEGEGVITANANNFGIEEGNDALNDDQQLDAALQQFELENDPGWAQFEQNPPDEGERGEEISDDEINAVLQEMGNPGPEEFAYLPPPGNHQPGGAGQQQQQQDNEDEAEEDFRELWPDFLDAWLPRKRPRTGEDDGNGGGGGYQQQQMRSLEEQSRKAEKVHPHHRATFPLLPMLSAGLTTTALLLLIALLIAAAAIVAIITAKFATTTTYAKSNQGQPRQTEGEEEEEMITSTGSSSSPLNRQQPKKVVANSISHH